MSEKTKQFHVDKRLIEEKCHKTETQNSTLNAKLNNVEKSLHFVKEKNKEELEVLKSKVSVLESKLKNYSSREIQIQAELQKREKEVEDLKDEIKRLMKPVQQKTGLDPFEFTFGKGLWISYTLSSNNQKSIDDPISDLKDKSTNIALNKLNTVLEKLKSYEAIIESLIDKLKETYSGILAQVLKRVYSMNLEIDENMCLVERIQDPRAELIKRSKEQFLIFEENDLKYDLINDRYTNIKTSFANNCLKLSICFNLYVQSHEIVERTNNPEKLERLGELIIEYRTLQADINFLFASIFTAERRQDSIEKIQSKLNRLQSIFSSLWKEEKSKMCQMTMNASEASIIQAEMLGFARTNDECEQKDLEVFNSNFTFELAHFSNLLNTLGSYNELRPNESTYK